MDPKNTRIDVRIPAKLKADVHKYADKQHISISTLVVKLLYGLVKADKKTKAKWPNIEK